MVCHSLVTLYLNVRPNSRQKRAGLVAFRAPVFGTGIAGIIGYDNVASVDLTEPAGPPDEDTTRVLSREPHGPAISTFTVVSWIAHISRRNLHAAVDEQTPISHPRFTSRLLPHIER